MLNGYAASKLACRFEIAVVLIDATKSAGCDNFNCESSLATGYGFLEEILVALHRNGATLREIPITYHVRHSGHSKLSWSDATGALQVIRRLRTK